MTRVEILDCLTDRPCDYCKFHESGRCERWNCVFEEKPDDAEECEDAISRAEAIRIASGYCHWTNIPDELAKLPSVTPKQKMGHWIKVDDEEPIAYDCSECVAMVSRRYRFCPDCGAKMGESEDQE